MSFARDFGPTLETTLEKDRRGPAIFLLDRSLGLRFKSRGGLPRVSTARDWIHKIVLFIGARVRRLALRFFSLPLRLRMAFVCHCTKHLNPPGLASLVVHDVVSRCATASAGDGRPARVRGRRFQANPHTITLLRFRTSVVK